eukprot:sb/3469476/
MGPVNKGVMGQKKPLSGCHGTGRAGWGVIGRGIRGRTCRGVIGRGVIRATGRTCRGVICRGIRGRTRGVICRGIRGRTRGVICGGIADRCSGFIISAGWSGCSIVFTGRSDQERGWYYGSWRRDESRGGEGGGHHGYPWDVSTRSGSWHLLYHFRGRRGYGRGGCGRELAIDGGKVTNRCKDTVSTLLFHHTPIVQGPPTGTIYVCQRYLQTLLPSAPTHQPPQFHTR